MNTNRNLPDLGPACAGVASLLGGISDDQLGGPTPCPDYAVSDLLSHFLALTAAFRDAARKEPGPTTEIPPTPFPEPLDPDWRELLPRQLDTLAAAWRSPTAWEGDTRVGGVDLPGEAAGRFGLNEVLIHGWDLARSTGQAYAPDEASLRSSYTLLIQPGEGRPFGPPVEVHESAPLLDRVVGLSGRRPEWAAAGT
ncbi:TIGR03086 family metal-binding protein [Streptomyces sp. NPDC088725]|uniref:TIGR03086 family metal-binding protein n=1 Tax=Streptomyces sp. NPDC088725 TaxID=3365873 RepID=UPI00382C6EF5